MSWTVYDSLGIGAGGGVSQRVIVPPDSPFTNAASVAAFYSTPDNRNSWLRNSTEENIDGALLTVIVVDDNTGFPDASSGVNTYQWGGTDQVGSYNITDWVIYQGLNAAEIKELLESNPDTNTVTDEEKGFLGTTREYGGDNYLLSGTPRVESTGLNIGNVLNIRDYGNLLGVEYSTPNNTVRIPDYLAPNNASAGKIRRFSSSDTSFSQTISAPSNPPANTSNTLSQMTFNFTLPNDDFIDGSLGRSFVFTASSVINNFVLRLSNGSNVLKYWPSEKNWIDNSNQSSIPIGEFEVDLNDSPYFAFNDTYTIDVKFDTGGTFLSSSSDVNVPACSADFQLGRYVFSQDELTLRNLSDDATAILNSSYTIDLTNPVTITLPSNAAVNDIVRIQAVTNIGGNILTIDGVSPNSINVQRADGTIDRDQTVTTQQSKQIDFIFTSTGWSIYNL